MDFYLDPFEFPAIKKDIRSSFESYVSRFEAAFKKECPMDLDRDPDDIKRDLFLTVAGEDFLQDLEEILSYPECSSFEVILVSFLAKYKSHEFLLADALEFRSLEQKECESVPDFVSRVRIKASLLNYHCSEDLEQMILIQTLLGIQDKQLCQDALENAWNLDELISQSESLDREVVVSLKETDTLVSKSENGAYYDQRALEKRNGEDKLYSSPSRQGEVMSLGDAFSQSAVVPTKKICMDVAFNVRGLTIALQESEKEEDDASKETKRKILEEILSEFKDDDDDDDESMDKGRRILSAQKRVQRGKSLKGPLRCNICADFFDDKKKLIRHREKSCKWCSLCFQTRSEFSLHNVEAHNNTTSQCTLCQKVFTSKSGLDLHMQTMHERNEKFRCGYCGNGFPIERMLSAHIKRVHLKERKFNCDRCGKRFETSSLLTKHINGVHEKKISAICHICSKAFTQDSCYKAHVLRVHENVRNFKCDVCDARFHASADLQKHKKGVHDKILDYVCEYCKKGFSRNSILQKHIKAIHSNERDFQCSLCSNAYVSKYNLNRHVQEAHERVKQKCDICLKDIAGFGTGNLAKHKRTAHGIASSNTLIHTQ
uniref:Zinc finger protein 271like [Acyrthosiphon pisum] n=1 Tax=Lepeophtheirus salmonis TaxID=72036 RepID=A0A0K2UI59_LEPSM